MKKFGQSFFTEVCGGFLEVFKRFPLVLISAMGLVVTESYFESLSVLIATFGLGVPLLVLVALVRESLVVRGTFRRWLPELVGISLLACYGLTMHLRFGERIHQTFYMRLGMILAIVHLAIAFLPPLLVKAGDAATWEYNKSLLSRFLITAFYSVIFYLGTALAMVSIQQLFDLRISGDIYYRTWLFFAVFFNTALFLGGIPNMAKLQRGELDFPKWIQFLCKFILLPLVAIYFIILYAYLIKIGIEWDWPKGMVGYPVFILSAIGGLAGLLMWPLTLAGRNAVWAKTFWKWYFPLLTPLSVILLFALQQRFSHYGFTELRYGGLILAVWLFSICLFFSIKRTASFRIIPISLCGILLVTVVGPFSPRSMGYHSQWNRLEALLEREGWLEDGKLVRNPHVISDTDYDSVFSIIGYLKMYYNPVVFQNWKSFLQPRIPKDTKENRNRRRNFQIVSEVVEFTGAKSEQEGFETSYRFSLNLKQRTPIKIDRSSLFYKLELYQYSGSMIGISGQNISLRLLERGERLVASSLGTGGKELAALNMDEWVSQHELDRSSETNHRNLIREPSEMTLSLDLGELGSVSLVGQRLDFEKKEDRWRLISGDVYVFVFENK